MKRNRIDAYLKRIAFHDVPSNNLETLDKLHKCHVIAVPFENLDIHANQEIILDLGALFQKVVNDHRGGFCYELNYLFCDLLVDIGINAKIISAQIFNEDKFGPTFDHMAIIAEFKDEKYLLDVGYGDLFIKPLSILDGVNQFDGRKYFKILQKGDDSYYLYMSKDGIGYDLKYTFQDIDRKIEDFHQQCLLKQTSPDSYFVKNKIVTLPFAGGRKTIFNDKYIVKTAVNRNDFLIANQAAENDILEKDFNITI